MEYFYHIQMVRISHRLRQSINHDNCRILSIDCQLIVQSITNLRAGNRSSFEQSSCVTNSSRFRQTNIFKGKKAEKKKGCIAQR
jgi:hypothetical protein